MIKVDSIETPKEMKVRAHVGQSLSGRYKVMVVDKDENIVYEQKDWAKNLILNQGMEALTSLTYQGVMGIAFNGSGVRPNYIYAGASTGSLASSTVTLTPSANPGDGLQSFVAASSGYSAAASVGDMIKFDNGNEYRITNVGGATTLTVTPTGTEASVQSFTLWKTSQVGLQSPVHVAGSGGASGGSPAYGSSWFTGTGYCGTQTTIENVTGQRRTWDFAYETSSVTFTEVGVGWPANGNTANPTFTQANVFSRVVLPNTLSLTSGQKMRLIYELDVAFLPYTASTGGFPMTASITNWPVSPATDTGARYNTQYFLIQEINTNGNASTAGNSVLEPASTPYCFVSTYSSSVLNASGAGTNRQGSYHDYVGIESQDPYTPLSFTRYKNYTFPTTTVSSNIRCMGLGYTQGNPATGNAFVVQFNQNQTKTNVQTLSLTWIYTWGRVLA
jgi:hypothetical protein